MNMRSLTSAHRDRAEAHEPNGGHRDKLESTELEVEMRRRRRTSFCFRVGGG